ncbi:MAG: M3 family oligoendopeptidase [Rickettsiales bacterium]|nr:M3 family oligoendopeptidase [Rickettsiales bacterium]
MFFKEKKSFKSVYITVAALIFVAIVFFFFKDEKNDLVNKYNEKIKNMISVNKDEKDLGNMPNWNLSDLYNSINDKQIELDIQQLEKEIKKFQLYRGRVKDLDGKGMYDAIISYENIGEIMCKLGSYSHLKYAENLSLDENVKFYQKINEKLTELSSNLIFFPLEINKIPSVQLDLMYTDSKSLRVYKSVIDEIRLFKPHQLNEKLERLMMEKSLVGRDAWSRLFDETMDNMVFEYKGKQLNQSEMLELMNNKDEEIRKETSKIFGETLAKQEKLFAYITNTLAKDKEINDRWRKYKTPISSMNLSNLIDDEVVEALRKTVKENYKNTAHRYYAWKAKQLGKEKLHYYDRNAPLPYNDDKIYKYEEAKNIVLSAYQDFSPEMAKIGQEFFDNDWIDVPTRQGKRGGAFMSPTTPKVHPYILLNYVGKTRDVMTLAHELGHGVHQTLSDKNGFLMSHPPLTLAETASVFGEQLTFRRLLSQEQDTQKRKAILASKIEDMLNTVVRQIAFLEFETKVHGERKNGEIPLDRLNQIWLDVQKESLGEENFIFDDEYKNYWMYIPHFIHDPFYVYSYAFGDCLVNSLYSIYQTNPNNFEQKYLTLLSAGSTKKYDEVLKPFGLNPKNPDFWQKGINVLSNMIDELENLN